MTVREDEIKRVMAELEGHIAEVEASVTVLKTLIANGEDPGEPDPR